MLHAAKPHACINHMLLVQRTYQSNDKEVRRKYLDKDKNSKKKSGCKINFKKIDTNESYPSKTGSFYDFGRVDGLNSQIFVSQVYSCTRTIINRKNVSF